MKTVLVTGANRGIGLEFVRQYAADGWSVIACCRKPGEAKELKALPGEVRIEKLDVASDVSIDALAKLLKNQPIDVLINNAGIYGGKQDFGNTDAKDWLEVMQVNVIAPLHMLEAFAGNLAAGKEKKALSLTSKMGSIGDGPSGGGYIYRSSKAALNMTMATAARDLKRHDIIVIVAHPGWVETDMGGKGAPVTPKASVAGLRKLVAGLKPADSGKFFNYTGETLPW
jgi:NAD(P)-dependent dehydrogenase (short-subunit alcohol dehydrogenase family)